jgi:two-component system sporulation sensor kinase A
MFGVKDIEAVKGFKLFEDPNLPQDAKQRLLNGESVKYEAVFDFDVVKAQNLYETTKSGQCFLESFFTQWGTDTSDLKGFLVHVIDITERKQVEEVQRESAEQYHVITSTSMDGFALVDTDGHLLDVNEAYSRMIGYSRDELLKMSILDIDAIDTPDDIRERLQKIIEIGPDRFESRHRRKDGHVIDVEVSTTFMRQSGHFLVFLRDITERKRAEETLCESEERYRQLFELESDAIFLIENETGRILEANSAASALYGYSHEELLTKKNTDLSAEPEETQRVTQTIPPTSDQVVTIPLRFHRKRDGTIFPVEITGRFFIRQGRQVHIAAIRDITDRKRAEKALKESEEKFRGFVERNFDAIVSLDIEGWVTYTSPAVERILGYKSEEVIGKHFRDFFPESEIPRAAQAFTEVSKGGSTQGIQVKLLRKDGSPIYVESNSSPILKDGVIVGIQGIYRDITERKQAEEQIKQYNILLEQAVQEKQQKMEVLFERLLRQEKLATIGQIAGSIAHELRNPLGAVKNSVFFLTRLYQKQQLDASNPKVKEHLDLIGSELDISERVISDLLQMTRMKPPQREQTDLRSIIVDAVEHCHLSENIHLTIKLQPDPFIIWADPGQLRQVFINVLTNAVQAIEGDGNITIRATHLAKEKSTTIEIENDGLGIEPDALSKVFEPLYTTKATGTGLGLSICKQIIENHQGQISIRSQNEQGTTVTIGLPKE